MSSVFGNIIDGLKKLMQALQAIEPAPDSTTVYFNDQVLCKNPSIPDVSTTYASDMIQMENGTEEVILNSTEIEYTPPGGPTSFITWSALTSLGGPPNLQTVLNTGNTAVGQSIGIDDGSGLSFNLSPNGLIWSPNPWGGVTNYNWAGLVINGADFNTNHTVSGISIEKPSTTKMTYYVDDRLSIVNANMPFIFEIDNWFMRYNCGFSLRTDLSINVVSKTDAFKVSEGGMNFDFDSFTDYLTPGGDAGFSVILSNSYNLDIDVTTPDIMFYAHSVGATSSPFTLKKYATARFTLVVVTSYPIGYAWAVSMY